MTQPTVSKHWRTFTYSERKQKNTILGNLAYYRRHFIQRVRLNPTNPAPRGSSDTVIAAVGTALRGRMSNWALALALDLVIAILNTVIIHLHSP